MEVSEINELVAMYGKSIYGFCHKLAKNQIDTDDLYQETFMKAMELCHKIEKGNNPKGFLISIAIGLWKNNRRKYARRLRIAPKEELNDEILLSNLSENETNPEDILINNEFSGMIQKAVETLNYKLRIPLYMYYTADMSNEDIAFALNIPQGTVKSRLFKARKTLRKILELEVGRYEKS